MPRFEPFAGIRYNAEAGYLDDVIAPPYDVISSDQRTALASRSPYNAVHLELPEPSEDLDRYANAARLWQEWREEKVLVADDEPCFYVYRMGFHDETGRARQTVGVLGALALSPPGAEILPHERTTPKAKDDRLNLLRATRANLSPIWALSATSGLSGLCETQSPPDARATDDDGVHHRLWRITSSGVTGAIIDAVGSNPVIVADGHHRLEVALTYQREVDDPGRAGAILCYVVELVDDQLVVGPIHRLLRGPSAATLPRGLERFFGVVELAEGDPKDDGLVLVTSAGRWLLRPLPELVAAAEHDLDSSRLDTALRELPDVEVSYQHGAANVAVAVANGTADAGVILRPATVDQIAQIGHGGQRMPPKTTFFWPKPRTGMVFRSVA